MYLLYLTDGTVVATSERVKLEWLKTQYEWACDYFCENIDEAMERCDWVYE